MPHTSNPEELAAPNPHDRLVLHVRRYRQSYRDQQLAQTDIEFLGALSGRQVRSFDRCRKLPTSIDTLLTMSLVLEVPMEELIAPHVIAERRREIEARRAAFHEMQLANRSHESAQ